MINRDDYLDKQAYKDKRDSAGQLTIERRVLSAVLRTFGQSRKAVIRRVGEDDFRLSWLWEGMREGGMPRGCRNAALWEV